VSAWINFAWSSSLYLAQVRCLFMLPFPNPFLLPPDRNGPRARDSRWTGGGGGPVRRARLLDAALHHRTGSNGGHYQPPVDSSRARAPSAWARPHACEACGAVHAPPDSQRLCQRSHAAPHQVPAVPGADAPARMGRNHHACSAHPK
jgi:hypothetical protein